MYYKDLILFRRPFVAVRIVACPRPLVFAAVLDAILGGPSELLLGLGRRTEELRHIPWPPIRELHRQLVAARLLERRNHLKDRAAAALALQDPGWKDQISKVN